MYLEEKIKDFLVGSKKSDKMIKCLYLNLKN